MVKVAIGLGSNLGDRQQHINSSVELLKQDIQAVQLSEMVETPALLLESAPQEWNKPFLNAVLVGETTLSPHELLSRLQRIEAKLGREKQGKWSPRTIDLDILLYGKQVVAQPGITIPHPSMLLRDFVMIPLKQVAGDWLHPIAGKEIAQHQPTQLVGIVNVTPDSFSDGGQNFKAKDAIAHALQLIEQGAKVLDIGAESTRPNAVEISAEQEWERLQPVLEAVIGKAVISVDTRHAETAKHALDLGVDWINDVSAASNEALLKAVANHKSANYVLMHSLTVPANPSITVEGDVVEEVLAFAKEKIGRLAQLGIAKERIIFDVGIGFGKTAEQSVELLERITEFNVLGVALFVGHSRKSFMKLFTDAPAEERDALTLKYSKELAAKGVEYLRVHNVEMHDGF